MSHNDATADFIGKPAPWPHDCLRGSSLADLQAELLRLHELFRAGERKAGGEICKGLLFHLTQCLRLRYWRARDDHYWSDAVDAALMKYLEKPSRFDPERRCPLDVYLFHVATRLYCQAIAKAARRERHEFSCPEEEIRFLLENATRHGYEMVEEAAEEADEQLRRLIHSLGNDIERTFAEMRWAGIRDSAVYAQLLIIDNPALADASPEELKHEVKKVQDRTMHKLRYWAQQLDD